MVQARARFLEVNPRFLIVIPTIRQDWPEFAPTLERIREGLTLPSRLVILDGSRGKPAALNAAHAELLVPAKEEYYVTLDDDIVPQWGWQDAIHQAFVDFPELSAASAWYGDSPEMLRLMGAERTRPPETRGASTVRFCHRGHHLLGGNITFRREFALKVGPMPLPDHRYVLYEDAWRGRRVQAAGGQLGFVMGARVEMVTFAEPHGYRAEKEQGIARSREGVDRILASTGVGDPALLRLRRWVARLRGRA